MKRRMLKWYDHWKYQARAYKLTCKAYALAGYQAGYRAGLVEGRSEK